MGKMGLNETHWKGTIDFEMEPKKQNGKFWRVESV